MSHYHPEDYEHLDTIASYFSKDERIVELEKQLADMTAKYDKLCGEKVLLAGRDVRKYKAAELLKKGKLKHIQIAERTSLSIYQVNRLSIELNKGLRD